MAKKFVRGVTGIEDIESYDKSLTNVNDLVSDGQNTYVHTKKGKTESYYNITNAVNQVKSSDNTLTINKENDTISISNKSLATKQELADSNSETNAQLAQKQNKLTAMLGVSITGDSISLTTFESYNGDLNNITDTCLAKPIDGATNLPSGAGLYGIISVVRISDIILQKYHSLNNTIYTRLRSGFGDGIRWTQWVKVTSTEI